MRFKESPVGQADRAAEEGEEPVTDVFAIHGSGLRRFDSNPTLIIATADGPARAAARTVNHVAAE